MFNEIALKIEKYMAKNKDFAIAQVIDRIAPSSGKVGDKAIVLETGELIGWIGGGCVRGIIIKEALEVIKSKKFRKVRVSPNGGSSENENFKQYIMSCKSKGTVEVLIEPVITQPKLIIAGKSNIARNLVKLAIAADFKVVVVANEIDPDMFPSVNEVVDKLDFSQIDINKQTHIIVTTQGDRDKQTVRKALETQANYVGFVASKNKSIDIRSYLKEQGISNERINDLRSPVGFDINAKLASEVAISILAEIINNYRTESNSILEESQEQSCCDTESNSIVEESQEQSCCDTN